jgi:hypothetical protein
MNLETRRTFDRRKCSIGYFGIDMGCNETPGEGATLQEADRVYVQSGGSFKELVVSLLTSESFLYRSVQTEGAKK